MSTRGDRGAKKVYAAVFDAPEPSRRGFVGYVAWLGITGAGFGVYRRAWLLVVAGVSVAAVALAIALWLKGREPTESQVELPSIGIHYLYAFSIIGVVIVGAAVAASEWALALVGAGIASLSGVGLWFAWRRRRSFGA